jgi:hypothetical protein
MLLREFWLAAITPITNLISPRRFANRTDKRFLFHAALYASVITSLVISGALVLRSTINQIDTLYATAMVAGACMLPFVITGIGFLLHLTKPAKSKKDRLLVMLALPWHIFGSFFAVMTMAMFVGLTYALSQSTLIANPVGFVSDTLSSIIFVVSFLCYISFVYGLKNIRGTSAFQNLGDATIIFALLLLPWIYKQISS